MNSMLSRLGRRVLLCILSLVIAAAGWPAASGAADFVPRLEAPDKSNAYYYSKNPFYTAGYGMPNCTAYAWGRVYEITGTRPTLSTGNAYGWYGKTDDGYARGQEPQLGAVACWGGGGHVAVVEKIEGSRITLSESSWGGKYFNVRTTSDVPSLNPKWQGYIYTCGTGQSASSSATSAVTFSKAADPAYTAKEKLTETNAVVVTQITKPSGVKVTQMGLYLSDADGNLIKKYSEKVSNVPASQTKYHSWFDITEELGVQLLPGTEYRYQFFGIFDGSEVKGDVRTPKTLGSAEASPAPTPAVTIQFAPATDSSYTSKERISETSAVLVSQITKPSGVRVTQMGMYLYDARGNLIKKYAEKVSNVADATTRYHSWVDTASDMGISLSPDTTYSYRFFGIFDGKEFEGDVRSFTTSPSSAAAIPKPTTAPTNTPAPTAAPDAALNVQFSPATDSSYKAREKITATSASVVSQITKPSGVQVSQMGLCLYDANGSLIKKYSENVSNVAASTTRYHSWFDTSSDLGVQLNPGTSYAYRFFGVFNGTEIMGPVRTFETSVAQSAAPTQTPSASTDGSVGQKIVERALTYVDKVPYVWGGTKIDGSDPGADCSGFICRLYEKFGFNLWSNRTTLQKCGTNLGTDLSVALPGDIIWYTGHVAIYAGRTADGTHMIVHENATNNNVGYTPAKLSVELRGVIRIPGITGGETSTEAPVCVWFSPASDAEYTAKEKVADTSAVVVSRVTKIAGTQVTQTGLYLYDTSGNLIKRHAEKTTNVPASRSVYHSWFDISSDLGITLTPGTTYGYQFFGVFDGTEVKGDMRTFTTAGTTSQTDEPVDEYFRLTFNANGGKIVIEGETEELTAAVKQNGSFDFDNMPDPVRDGYTFDGWYTAKSGGSRVTGISNMTGNVVVYAHWIENASSTSTSVIDKYVTVNESPMSVMECLTRLGTYGKGGWISPDAASSQHVSDSANVCTGMVYHLASAAEPLRLICVKGDVMGTGKVTVSQLVTLTNALQGRKTLTGAYLKAGDMNNNGGIDLTDLIAVAGKLVGKSA